MGRLLNLEAGSIDTWNQAINDIEDVLIASHNPAWNKKEVNKVLQDRENNFIVMNWFDCGSLSLEVSSLRFTYHYWNEKDYPFKRLGE